MYLDPEVMSWLLIGGASICAFMVGKEWGARQTDSTIETCIEYLCAEGYINHTTNDDGEIEIIKCKEK
tara:strand:- start:160 stop:363 length:204 start_codon:yes stop_codon:yes gene_type:complete